MLRFQSSTASKPLASILREARERAGYSLGDMVRLSSLRRVDLIALEGGVDPESGDFLEKCDGAVLDSRRARLQAVTYARTLGLDPGQFRESLPKLPELLPGNQEFLSNWSRPNQSRWRSPFEILAPLGRAALYLLLTFVFFGGWSMLRQLSRVRSMPWVTSNSHLYTTPSR